MQSFLGTVETFTVTAAAAVPANTIVVQGSLIGVTHQSFKTGETVVAYLASRRNHYGFPCTALEAAADQGAAVYRTSAGALTFTATNNTQVGVLYKGAALGAAELDVLMN